MSQKPANMVVAKRAPEKKPQVALSPSYDPSRVVFSKSYSVPPKKAEVTPLPAKTSSPPTKNQPKVSLPTSTEIVHVPACREVTPVPVGNSFFPMTIQPEVPPPKKIEVVYIPADRRKNMEMQKFTAIKVDSCDASTKDKERKLGQISDVRRYCEDFEWESRSLYEANPLGGATPDEYKGTWFAYKCIKSNAGLQPNESLEKIPHLCAYGDVIVFRLKDPGYFECGQANFGRIPAEFWESYNTHGVAKCLLSSLAMLGYKDKKEKKQIKETKEKKEKEKKKKKEGRNEAKAEATRGADANVARLGERYSPGD